MILKTNDKPFTSQLSKETNDDREKPSKSSDIDNQTQVYTQSTNKIETITKGLEQSTNQS